MAHKISKEEAIRKYEHELEVRELVKQGKYKSKRRDQKRKFRELKFSLFVDKLRSRGGYGPDKKKEKKKNVGNSN